MRSKYKRFVVLTVLLFFGIVIALIGCTYAVSSAYDETINTLNSTSAIKSNISMIEQKQSTFSILEKVSISSDSTCYILVDNDTGIEYAYIEFDDAYGGGNCITPLYTNNVGNGIDLKKYK